MGHRKRWKERVQEEGGAQVAPRAVTTTPVQRHILRTRGTEPEPPAPGRPLPKGHAAAQRYTRPHERAFAEAVEGLHGLTIAEKLERKKALVEQYRAHVEALLRAGEPRVQLWTWWIVWLYDLGRIEEFIPRARQGIAHGWRTSFRTDLRAWLYDKVLEWADAEHRAGRSVQPYFGQVYPGDVPHMLEVVAAKYHKLAGDVSLRAADQARDDGNTDAEQEAMEAALGLWRKAREAYEKAGVNTRIKEAEKRLRKLAEAA